MHAKYEPYLAKHVVRRSAHRRQRRRQTNHDCIGSRPTLCREPKSQQAFYLLYNDVLWREGSSSEDAYGIRPGNLIHIKSIGYFFLAKFKENM